jgi:uncharacterized iron-regulated membrane protein
MSGGSRREALTWLHRWLGLALGALLFAIFWMGTLAVFDREIDRWMMPSTRLAPTTVPLSADKVWQRFRAEATGSPLWVLTLPSEREPVARVQFAPVDSAARAIRIDGSRKGIPLPRERLAILLIDPANGSVLADPGTRGATGFFFPFHWHLMLGEGSVGQWIVGLAGLAMLISILSGLIVHRELFTQFFTLRATKRGGRLTLDLHNAAGVLALPFHALITFSGLAIFYFLYLPAPLEHTHQGGERQLFVESRSGYSRPKAGRPGELASLDAMIARAEVLWGGGRAARVSITYPGDAAAYVQVTRTVEDRVVNDPRPVYFDAASGALLKFAPIRPVASAQRYIAGLHFTGFNHWLLRWLYFVFGLLGCALIATGALFWLQRQRKTGAAPRALAAAEAAIIASTTGLIGATAAYLLANRLLPLGGTERAEAEMVVFGLAWVALAAHAALRGRAAWREQCAMIAAGGLAAVACNEWLTGDNLARTLGRGDWAVGGTDLVLLIGATIAGWSALRLGGAAPARANLVTRVSAQ